MHRGGPTEPPCELIELARHPDAVFVAFDRTGSSSVEAHPDLRRLFRHVWLVESPMDPLAPSSIPTAVSLFEIARRRGHACGVVEVKDAPGLEFRLHVFDLTDTYDCFGSVVVPATADATTGGTAVPTPLAPKYMVLRLDVHGVMTEIDSATTAALGWQDVDMKGRSALEFVHVDDHEAAIGAWVEVLQYPGATQRVRQRFLRVDATPVWMEVTETNRLDDPDECAVVVELIDVSDEMAALESLRQREELLAQLADALPTGVLQVSAEGEVEFSNTRWYEILGIDRDAPPDAALHMVDEQTRRLILTRIAGVRDTGLPAELTIDMTRPQGDELTCRVLLRHLEDSRPGSVLATLEDITERHRLQRRLAAQATQDPLTGLLNRSALMERLAAFLDEHPAAPTAVLFVDLDDFKSVNDTRGHAAGDRFLCDVARAISAHVREDDLVARIGGDEFVIVAPRLRDEAMALDLGRRVAQAIDRLSSSHGYDVSASTGYALSTDHPDADRLLAAADAAMYAEKRAKRRSAD